MTEEKKFVPAWKIYSSKDLSKKWFIFYRKDGKRAQRIYGNLASYTTYKERMAAALAMIADQIGEQEERRTLEDKLFGFLLDKKGVWRRKTYYTYYSKVKIFTDWLNGRSLSTKKVEEFFIHLSQDRSRTTYNIYRRTLKMVFLGIGEQGLLKNIDKLKHNETPAKYFQEHQARRLRDHLLIYDPDLFFYCQFVYYCFLRPNSELRLLKVGDVDLDRNCIRVPGNISKNWKNQYVTIPLAFREKVYRELYNRSASDWLFPGKFDQSKPIGYNTMSNRHRKILKELGFGTEYKLYSWKHTGAVACVMAGVNIKELQIQLRHENLETVDKYLRQLGINDLHNLERLFPPI